MPSSVYEIIVVWPRPDHVIDDRCCWNGGSKRDGIEAARRLTGVKTAGLTAAIHGFWQMGAKRTAQVGRGVAGRHRAGDGAAK